MNARLSVSSRLVACLGIAAITATGVSGAGIAIGSQVNGQIAFTVKRGKAESIAIRSLGGGSLRLVRLPRFRGKAVAVLSIAWSPRADRFAFSDSAGRIFVAAASGAALRLVAAPGGLRWVTVNGWSADGRVLAVDTSVPGCRAGEPRLLAVRVDGGVSRTFPAHPLGAPAASARNPAYIGPVAWLRNGSQLVYGWQQFRNGDCRNMGGSNRPTRVMTIGSDGKDRRELASLSLVFDAIWSPTGRAIALARGCGYNEPFAWRPDGREVIIATTFDGCTTSILDRSSGSVREAEIWPSKLYDDEPGTGLYAVTAATGEARVLRALGKGTSFEGIGTVPEGAGIVALVGSSVRLVPLDGSPLVKLPPLRAPKGMTLGTVAAAGFPG